MADVVEGFFQKLGARGHEPLFQRVSGTFRFEIGRRQWFVRVRKGNVIVSRERAAADCVLVSDEPLFAAFLAGEKNAFTAGMRGDVQFEGDVGLCMLFQRVFPGPDDQVGAGGGAEEQVPA
jgi:putative sterol carrier protein